MIMCLSLFILLNGLIRSARIAKQMKITKLKKNTVHGETESFDQTLSAALRLEGRRHSTRPRDQMKYIVPQ